MRLLVAGLVLIALAVGVSEYNRRHEPPSGQGSGLSGKKAKKAATPPTMTALLETKALENGPARDSAEFAKAVEALHSTAKSDGFATVLSGQMTLRELKGGPTFAAAVIGVGKQAGLVRVSPNLEVTVVAARDAAVTALAVDGDTVWWAEGSRVFSAGADGVVTSRTTFVSAAVAGLAAGDGVAVAALVPVDGDPFSTEATGAVVKLEASGKATLVVGEQVRPHDVLVRGSDVYFVAGYPSGLTRASLDGSFSSQIAERADGPLAHDGDGIVFRLPQSSAPEVRRVPSAGGNGVTLARGDIDWLAGWNGATRYTTVGVGARLYEARVGVEPVELIELKGVSKGVAMVSEHTVFAATMDDGVTVIRVR